MTDPVLTRRAPERDVAVIVAHDVPVLLHGRRGPVLGVAPLRTPARIRHVPPEALAARVHPMGLYHHFAPEEGLSPFEGRLWRRIPRGPIGAGPGCRTHVFHPAPGRTHTYEGPLAPAMAVSEVAAALGDGTADGRHALSSLPLSPWIPELVSGRFARIAPAEPDPARIALDLRPLAASAMAGRVGRRLLHDGTHAWLAIPAPLVTPSWTTATVIVPAETWTWLPSGLPGTSPAGVEAFADHAVLFRPDEDPDGLRAVMRAAAARLAGDMAGPAAAPPLEDVGRCLRILLLRTVAATRTIAARNPAAAEAAAPHLAGLLPAFASAAGDLLDAADLADVAERIAACAGAMLAVSPPRKRDENQLAVPRLVEAASYVETVARPRIAAAFPSPAEDVDALGGLAP